CSQLGAALVRPARTLPDPHPNPVPNIVVSASHLPPSAPSSPPSSVTALETRSQKHTRDSFFATMDPMMKAYLDKMNDDAVARATKQDVDNKAILKAVATQSAWIDALLELSVAYLQAASTSVAPTSESLPPASSPLVAHEIQGQPSQVPSLHPGGPPSVTVESPAVSPIMDMLKRQEGIHGRDSPPGTQEVNFFRISCVPLVANGDNIHQPKILVELHVVCENFQVTRWGRNSYGPLGNTTSQQACKKLDRYFLHLLLLLHTSTAIQHASSVLSP
ncbi:hypothetical protein ZWY2020_025751, partial [Hordeum vulgare]